METFSQPKILVENLQFLEHKRQCLDSLSYGMIDAPIVDLIKAINSVDSCFTLQCCYGHFLYNDLTDPENLDPLPDTNTLSNVEYRIAYIAFCIDNSSAGRDLINVLLEVTSIDPERIQFCSPNWFWERQVNSYALQVEPERLKGLDRVTLSYEEALIIEETRGRFFQRLREIFVKTARSGRA